MRWKKEQGTEKVDGLDGEEKGKACLHRIDRLLTRIELTRLDVYQPQRQTRCMVRRSTF